MTDPCLPLARAIAELQTLVPELPAEEPELELLTVDGHHCWRYTDGTQVSIVEEEPPYHRTRPAQLLEPLHRALIGCPVQRRPLTWRTRVRRWARLQRIGLQVTFRGLRSCFR